MKSTKANPNKEISISKNKSQEEKKLLSLNGVYSAYPASMKSSTTVPTFEYQVQAKDGIRLVVDLNLKRSDWLKSMEKAVCVCQNHSKPEFESFRKEVERLGDRNNLKLSSLDKTSASDSSKNSFVQNSFSIKSMSSEIGSFDQKSELVLKSFENSAEVQLSDFSSPHQGSLCSRTAKTCSENLFNSTNEVYQEAGGDNRWSTVKNKKRINSAEGMEVSGNEENELMISASYDALKRKKRYYKSDHVHGQSHERILRSTKTFGGKFLEHDGVVIWRSSRLHSK